MPQKLRLWDKDIFGEEGRHVAAFIGERFYDQTLLRLGGNARQAKKELNYRLDVGASVVVCDYLSPTGQSRMSSSEE